MGRNFNQIETDNNLIKVIKPKKYEFEKTGKKSFRGFPVKFRDVQIMFDMQIKDDRHADAEFTVKSPKLSIDKPQPVNIIISNPEDAPKVEYGNGWATIVIQAPLQ